MNPEIFENYLSLAPDAVAICYKAQLEEPPYVIWVNESYCAFFQFAREEVIGRDIAVSHGRWDAFGRDVSSAFAAGQSQVTFESTFLREDGVELRVWVSFVAIPDKDGPGRHTICYFRDITELRQRERYAEIALAEHASLLGDVDATKARLEAAINTISDPLIILDTEYRAVCFNTAWRDEMLAGGGRIEVDMPFEEILRAGAARRIFGEAAGREEEWIAGMLAQIRGEIPLKDTWKVGAKTYRVHCYASASDDKVILRTDISELVAQQRALEEKNHELEIARAEADVRALHDELTGLGNRRFLLVCLNDLAAERARYAGEIAALHVDLDRFKQVNDTFGHLAGDHVLQVVADRLRQVAGPEDRVARVGGDEFIVLRHAGGADQSAEKLGEAIVAAMAEPIWFEGNELRIGASVGLAATPLCSEPDLLTNSDVALYKAKSKGKGRVHRFTRTEQGERLRVSSLTDQLQQAVDREEFIPYFQPQVDAHSGRIVAAEVLPRWLHPEKGVLPPSEFLPLADDLRLAEQIRAQIFNRAIYEARSTFAEDDRPALSFNVSLDRLLTTDLSEVAIHAAKYPGGIICELVESILTEDREDALRLQIDILRDAGIAIEIGGFGSGGGSIVALDQIAPDRIKIDRRLVQPELRSGTSVNLLKSIIDLGRGLNIGVTAEGVTSAYAAKLLAELGCDRLQGFFFGAPMTIDQIALACTVSSWPTPFRPLRQPAAGAT